MRRPVRFTGPSLSSLACVLALSAGCFRATAIIPGHAPAETHTRWVNGFFWGAVGDTVDAGLMCQGRPVYQVKTDRSAGNIALQWLTLGIYTPSRMSITCAQPPRGPYDPYPPEGYSWAQ